MSLQRVALVVNPTAGRGRGENISRQAQDILRAQGIDATVIKTKAPGDATRLAQELAPSVDIIFGLGGDGTINEIATGLLSHPQTVLGIIPVGTANVLAHEIGIPARNPLAAVEDLPAANCRSIDVAMVGESLALTVCGAGLESICVRDVSRARSGGRHGSMLRFVWPAVREFFTYFLHAPRFTIQVDGETMKGRSTSFVVSNTRIYGGFMSVTPTASVLDGTIHVCSRRYSGVIANILSLLAAVMWVKQPSAFATYAAGEEVKISTSRRIPLQIDGDNAAFELSPDQPLIVRVLPQHLRILLPQDAPFPPRENQK
jgi:YegS/Rv2252/BmrU family lipid kinase